MIVNPTIQGISPTKNPITFGIECFNVSDNVDIF